MKKSFTFILPAFLFISVLVAAGCGKRIETEKNASDPGFDIAAVQLIQEKQFDKLISYANAYIAKHPGYAPAWRFLVMGYYVGKKDLSDLESYLKSLLGEKSEHAYVHYALGYLYFLKDDFELSEDELRQSVCLDPNIALAQNNLGAVLSKAGKWEQALVHIQKALKLDPDLELAKNNLVHVRQKMSGPVLAESYDQLIDLIRSALDEDDTRWLLQTIQKNTSFITQHDLLMVRITSTLLDKAVEKELSDQTETAGDYFRLSEIIAENYKTASGSTYLKNKADLYREWTREEKEKYVIAEQLYSQGEQLRGQYKYEQAKAFHEKSRDLYLEIGYQEGQANSLQSLGGVHRMSDEYENARQRYEHALVIFRDIKDRLGQANSLQSLGDVHRSLAEYENARHRYEQALVIYREINARLGQANSLQSLGDVHRMSEEYENARQQYEQALVIFRDINARLGQANSLQSLGDVHRMLAEYENARQQYEQALDLQKKIGDRNGVIWTSYRLGQVSETTGNHSQAKKYFEDSIQVIEEVWNLMKIEEHKTSYFAGSMAPYESMIALLFRQKQGVKAYEYAERSKARSFLYRLGNKKINPRKDVPLKLIREEEELSREIVIKTRELMESNQKRKKNKRISVEELATQVYGVLKQAHRQVLMQIKLHSPEYASLRSVEPEPLKEIQNLLRNDPGMILIEYYTTEDATYIWVIDADQIHPYQINITRTELTTRISDFRTMVSNISFGVETLAEPASNLYDVLLKPVEKHFTGKQLIGIIPHGRLHYLPFEALMKNKEFLIRQDYRIFYLPNASSYKYCREKNTQKKDQIIAFGNPDGTLFFSEKEAEELKRLYPADTEIFTGNAALESEVKYYAGYTDILHFACHGSFTPQDPLYSALMLGPDASDDGRLEVHEIFQLKLKPAYLVTLSACETHLGGIYPGDEIVGLTRAFIYAGTPSILASLWKVDDYYTEKLMSAFYRELKKSTKTEALHTARQVMIKKYGKCHPFYWAGFVLIGDYR